MICSSKPDLSRSKAAMKPMRNASAGAASALERKGRIRPMWVILPLAGGGALSVGAAALSGASMGTVRMASSSRGGGSGRGAAAALVIGGRGAHNRTSQGVLQPASDSTVLPASAASRLLKPGPLSRITFSMTDIQSSPIAPVSIAGLPVLGEAAQQSYPTATLYIVATPIGNVTDISLRA